MQLAGTQLTILAASKGLASITTMDPSQTQRTEKLLAAFPQNPQQLWGYSKDVTVLICME